MLYLFPFLKGLHPEASYLNKTQAKLKKTPIKLNQSLNNLACLCFVLSSVPLRCAFSTFSPLRVMSLEMQM